MQQLYAEIKWSSKYLVMTKGERDYLEFTIGWEVQSQEVPKGS